MYSARLFTNPLKESKKVRKIIKILDIPPHRNLYNNAKEEMMYKIGEFSKITGLSVKALRYYDKEELLVPADRQDDNAYRLYDQNNYKTALLIKRLRQFEFSIAEIKDTLAICSTENDLSFVLHEKELLIQREIEQKRALIKKITASINQTLKEELSMNYEVKVEKISSIQVATTRYTGGYAQCGKYAGKVFRAAKNKASGDFFNLYHDLEYSELADVEVCVPVKSTVEKGDIKTRVLPSENVITTIHKGSYDKLGNAYKALFDYASDNQLSVKPPIREEYIKGPGMLFKGNPDNYVTKVMIPIDVNKAV